MKPPKNGLLQAWNTFFPGIQVKTKKKVFTKNEHFFPRIQVEICGHMHTKAKLSIGGDVDVDHTQIIGGIQ